MGTGARIGPGYASESNANNPVELVYSPWLTRFLAQVRRLERELVLVSPFIKLSLVRPLLMALPDKGIKITVVTRFSPSTFRQLSSDLAALSLLLDRPVALGATRIFALNRLHAKAYIFDGQTSYFGSSNLSISGMVRNLEIVAELPGPAYAARLCDDFTRLGAFDHELAAPDFEAMRQTLAETPALTTISNAAELVDTNDPVDDLLSEQVAVGSDLGNPDDFAPLDEARATSIDAYLTSRGQRPLNELAGIPFESPLALVPGRKLPDDERQVLRSNRILSAQRDLDRIRRQLVHGLVGTRDDRDTVDAAMSVFVSQTWCNEFPDLLATGIENQAFSELGENLMRLRLACAAISSVAESSVGAATLAVSHAIGNIDFVEILSALGWHCLLHTGDLGPRVARRQFSAILGVIAHFVGLDAALGTACVVVDEAILARVSPESLKPAKTRLQEIAQAENRMPAYEVHSLGGPDHSQVFQAIVKIGKTAYGPGLGASKKAATTAVAEIAMRQIEGAERPRGYLQEEARRAFFGKYYLSPERRVDCVAIAELLGIPIRGRVLELFDLALTHPSFSNENPGSRPHTGLAFIGSQLVEFLWQRRLVLQLGWRTSAKLTEWSAGRSADNAHALATCFNNLQIGAWLRVGRGEARQVGETALSDKTLSEVVQAILAAIYLSAGIDRADRFFLDQIYPIINGEMSEGQPPGQLLQERAQAELGVTPEYRVVQLPGGTPHKPLHQCTCFLGGKKASVAVGPSVKLARRAAALAALDKWKEIMDKFLIQSRTDDIR